MKDPHTTVVSTPELRGQHTAAPELGTALQSRLRLRPEHCGTAREPPVSRQGHAGASEQRAEKDHQPNSPGQSIRAALSH